jgi:uncharacterized protein YjiS (DUF1127 family)
MIEIVFPDGSPRLAQARRIYGDSARHSRRFGMTWSRTCSEPQQQASADRNGERIASLGQLIREIAIEPLRRKLRCRSCKRQLRKLDDHTLRDIGVKRADIDAAAPSRGAGGPATRSCCLMPPRATEERPAGQGSHPAPALR